LIPFQNIIFFQKQYKLFSRKISLNFGILGLKRRADRRRSGQGAADRQCRSAGKSGEKQVPLSIFEKVPHRILYRAASRLHRLTLKIEYSRHEFVTHEIHVLAVDSCAV
jgi:hypothetical protein